MEQDDVVSARRLILVLLVILSVTLNCALAGMLWLCYTR